MNSIICHLRSKFHACGVGLSIRGLLWGNPKQSRFQAIIPPMKIVTTPSIRVDDRKLLGKTKNIRFYYSVSGVK
jgi:hypothetical protein